ncbi:MAG: hypothetical protein WCY24_00765 [Lutispora sp.]
MKINKKTINILGIALVYTVTSSFVALMPDDLVATKSYFSAKGEVNAAISTLKPEEIIHIDAEGFDVKKWIQTGATGIYISNTRDDGKPVIVYFEVLSNLRDLVGGINPMKVYPGEKDVEELVMPIRDISLFELKNNVFSGTINVRAFNDYIKDLVIEIPEVEGNEILSIKSKEWPYGSTSMSLMRTQSNNSTDVDLLSKYDIGTYKDMESFIIEFEALEERFNQLQKAHDELLIEKDTLVKDKEGLEKEIERLGKEIDSIRNDKDELTSIYNSLYEETQRLRNHTCQSPSTGGSMTPAQPSVPVEPTPVEPTPTDPKPTDPEPTEPELTEPAPEEPEPTDPAPENPKPADPEPTNPEPEKQEDDTNKTRFNEPDNADIIDNSGKDDEDSGGDFIDDGGDDALPQDGEPQIGGDKVSGVIRDMANRLKSYI